VKVTEVQQRVLETVAKSEEPVRSPRSSLERLAKKGLVVGGRKCGWVLTSKGKACVK